MREIKNINKNWEFTFDNKKFEIVNLPHNISISPIISSGGRNFQGVSYYKKKLEIPELEKQESLLIYFEGAMQVMEIFLNDEKIGEHFCGYTPAVFDLTNHIKNKKEVIISIKLDNSDKEDVPPGKPQSDLDFTYEGGIYRDVKLIKLPKIYFTNPILENKKASGGIYVATISSKKENAIVRIQSHIKNNTNETKVAELRHTLFDENFKKIVSISSKLDFEKEIEDVKELAVVNPNLWNIYNPYLYNLISEIVVDGEIVDKIETKIGIRNFDITLEEGFVINGEKQRVSGGNYHQTFTQLGNAMPKSMLERDVLKLKDSGMMHIRSHYPFSEYFINKCDEVGIMLTISNPGWQFFKKGIFEERAYKNLRDILRWLRNHPSIILWEGILNETPMPVEFMKKIQKIIHEEIPYGSCYSGSDSLYSDVLYTGVDEGMIHKKILEELESIPKEEMEQYKNKPRWVREYGDSPDNFTDQSCAWRVPRHWGEDLMIKQVKRMTEDKLPWLVNYRKVFNAKSVAGFGVWPAMEHNRGYHINPCYGGFLDLQRIEKYSYYFFKSQKNYGEPMVFIANSFSELSPDDITIYSNCEKIKLYVNGKFVKEQFADDVPIDFPPFTFRNDFYFERNRSTLKAEGYIKDKVVAVDERTSHGVMRKLHLSKDDMGIDLTADSSDVIFIRCEALDDLGNRVFYGSDEHKILFTLTGEGEIIGDYIKNFELGITGILVKSNGKFGEIKIKAQIKEEQVYKNIFVEEDELIIVLDKR